MALTFERDEEGRVMVPILHRPAPGAQPELVQVPVEVATYAVLDRLLAQESRAAAALAQLAGDIAALRDELPRMAARAGVGAAVRGVFGRRGSTQDAGSWDTGAALQEVGNDGTNGSTAGPAGDAAGIGSAAGPGDWEPIDGDGDSPAERELAAALARAGDEQPAGEPAGDEPSAGEPALD